MGETMLRTTCLLALCTFVLFAHDDVEPPVARLMATHGSTGPFAMAGYRMGEAALAKLQLKRGSSDLEVIHYSPLEIQYTCIADGLQASTGASLGKMNLRIEKSARTYSVVRNRKTNQQVTLELTPDFTNKYLNLPQTRLNAEGLKLMRAPEASIFVVK